MYFSSGDGNGKGNVHPSQQTMPTNAITPVMQQNVSMQPQMYSSGVHPVMLPNFPQAYLPRQPMGQLYAPPPPFLHIPPNQMPAGFNMPCIITNPLIPPQPRPNLIQGHIPTNQNVLTLPGMNLVQGNLVPQAAYMPGTIPNPPPIRQFKSTRPRKHAIDIINPVTMKNIYEEDQELVSSENLNPSVNAGAGENFVGANSSEVPNQNDELENTEKIELRVKVQVDKREISFKRKLRKGKPVIEAEKENTKKILKDFCTSTSFDLKEDNTNHQSIPVEESSSNTIAHTPVLCNLDNNIEKILKQTTVLENPKKEPQNISASFNQSDSSSKSNVNATERLSHFQPDMPEKASVVGEDTFSVPNSMGTKIYPNFGKESKRKMNTSKRKKIHTAYGDKRRLENFKSFENQANFNEVDIYSNNKQHNGIYDQTKEKQILSNNNAYSNVDNIEAVQSSSSGEIVTKSYGNKSESNCNGHIIEAEDKKPTEENIEEGDFELNAETITDIPINKVEYSTKKTEPPQLIRYNEDQWSPRNLFGKKYYDLTQLYLLYNSPLSHKLPKLNKKARTLLVENPRPISMPVNYSNKKTHKNSHFFQDNNWETVQYSALGISRSPGGRSAFKTTKPSGNIYVRLSLKENVNLKESENAWKPTRFQLNDKLSTKVPEKEELFRKIRGILNKLTPEKFDKLLEEIMKLQIDTAEKMNGVMMLVFEKAIDEPNFSASYARLCHRLADKNLQCETQGSKIKSSNLVLFKTSLLDKTEREFHDNVIDLHAKNAKLKPTMDLLKNCADPKEKLELQTILEEKEYLLRKRSCGTVRFIGELFKMSMLTGSIIKTCINKLLDPKCEQKLECLCKLLTTVGKKFELTPVHKDSKTCHSLDDVFKKMQSIVDKKIEGGKISNRVRFMLQDVIELRKNEWITTNTEDQKHMLDPHHSERETVCGKKGEKPFESKTSSLKSSNFGADYFHTKCNLRNSSQETWNNQPTNSRQSVDPNKLRQIFNADNPIKLGDSSQFMWRRENQNPVKSNFYNKKQSVELHNRRPATRGSYYKEECFKSSMPSAASMIRSTSQNDLADLNCTKLKKIQSVTAMNLTGRSKEDESITTILDITNECSEKVRDTLNKMVDILLEDPVETCIDIWIQLPPKFHWVVVFNIFSDYLHLSKTKTSTRKALSNIILFLLDKSYLKQKDLCKGYVEFSKIAGEIVIDVPEAWKYIFEFIGDALYRNILPISFFWNEYLFESGMGKQFLTHFVGYFTTEYNLNCVQNLWSNSGLQLKNILNEQDIPIILQQPNFKFMQNEIDDSNLNVDIEGVMQNVLKLLENGASASNVIKYLSTNATTINKDFIKFLIKTLIGFSTDHEKCVLKSNTFEEVCIPLLRRYIDLNEDYEIECLNAIADYVRDVKGNSGVLINDLFHELYEAEVIPQDSFIQWRQLKLNTNTDNVLILGLNSFFCSLNHKTSHGN